MKCRSNGQLIMSNSQSEQVSTTKNVTFGSQTQVRQTCMT